MGMKEYVIGAGLALALALGATAHADTDAIMKKLRSLEGEWTLLDEQGEDTGQLGSEFRLTANGSALREFMFPGDEHEMLNVYHADGDRVLMTHYCGAGSQPRLEVVAADEGDGLLLKFESITNLPSPGAYFMHRAEFDWEGDDRLTVTWYGSENGEVADETTVMRLARRKD